MLVPVGVIPSSSRPEEPFCYPEDYEYQEDGAQPAKRERKEGSLRPRSEVEGQRNRYSYYGYQSYYAQPTICLMRFYSCR